MNSMMAMSQSHAYDHTMHLSPCFQLAGVARLCKAVSCNESSTRRTCVRVRARAGVKERATGRVKVRVAMEVTSGLQRASRVRGAVLAEVAASARRI